ncbi:MAG TPA: hypothetical protein VNR00_10655 [Opitutus sp.]|nr:hypothetical protein [Opitutus sp.]
MHNAPNRLDRVLQAAVFPQLLVTLTDAAPPNVLLIMADSRSPAG